MKINCIAIDDEPLALDVISAYCSKIPFLNLVQTFSNAIDAMEFLRSNRVDLIFLDIQMDGITGIQLLNTLRSKPHVILTTAFEDYAMQGFELEVDDYLLKPIAFDRFIKGVDKVCERILQEADKTFPEKQMIVSVPRAEPAYFFVKTETRIEKVDVSEVLFVEGMGDYWRIVTVNKRIMTLMNAKGIEEILHEPRFCRVHKSFFVAVDKIDFVERKSIKIGNDRIPVSDTYQKHFFEIIENNKMNSDR